MTAKNISWSISTKDVADLSRGWICELLVSSQTAHPTEPPRPTRWRMNLTGFQHGWVKVYYRSSNLCFTFRLIISWGDVRRHWNEIFKVELISIKAYSPQDIIKCPSSHPAFTVNFYCSLTNSDVFDLVSNIYSNNGIFQNICVSLDVNFNESLTNDVVSFEQLSPGLKLGLMQIYKVGEQWNIGPSLKNCFFFFFAVPRPRPTHRNSANPKLFLASYGYRFFPPASFHQFQFCYAVSDQLLFICSCRGLASSSHSKSKCLLIFQQYGRGGHVQHACIQRNWK